MLILTYCHDLFCYFYVARGKIFIENIMKFNYRIRIIYETGKIYSSIIIKCKSRNNNIPISFSFGMKKVYSK